MLSKSLDVTALTESLDQLRRALDIREQQRNHTGRKIAHAHPGITSRLATRESRDATVTWASDASDARAIITRAETGGA